MSLPSSKVRHRILFGGRGWWLGADWGGGGGGRGGGGGGEWRGERRGRMGVGGEVKLER